MNSTILLELARGRCLSSRAVITMRVDRFVELLFCGSFYLDAALQIFLFAAARPSMIATFII